MSHVTLSAAAILLLMTTHGACSVTYYQGDNTGSNGTTLRILVLLPEKIGDYLFPFGAEMSGAAVLSALQQIRAERLLPGVSFQADFADTGCDGVTGLGQAHRMLGARQYSAIIGPQCSEVCRHVARLATALNIPAFSGVCDDVEMLDKSQFSTLTRLIGTFEMTGFAATALLKRYSWAWAGILSESQKDIVWLLTKNGLEYSMERDNITLAASTVLDEVTDLETELLAMARVTRVILLAMNADTFREIMRLSIKHGLTNGDYIFISINFYKQVKVFGNYDWQQGDADDEAIKEAYKSVFFLYFYNREGSPDQDTFVASVKEGAATYFGYNYDQNEEVPYPAANLYEATYLYALSLNESIRAGYDVTDGKQLAQRLWGRTFDSITGGVTLNANGDREQVFMFRHLQDTSAGNIEMIATYRSDTKLLDVIPVSVTWPGGRRDPPPDRPECGFEGELCVEGEAARLRRIVGIFVGTLLGILLIGGTTCGLAYRRLKWDKEVAQMNWKVAESDISFNKHGTGTSMFSMISLKSGNSATNSKQSDTYTTQNFAWTGVVKGVVVAVKHMSHVTQVNLSDRRFLQEMKQLYDLTHPNITKFMGATVVTPNVYQLTEYCHKGSLQDLLENDNVELDLTFKYSLIEDIIKGLQYLHSSSIHAHGNMKSSNCVVDARFVVKLTDFGPLAWLATDTAKGNQLLWTAPELLEKTGRRVCREPAADLYALGVILQEITLREGPFYNTDTILEGDEIIERVRVMEMPPYRPSLPDHALKREMKFLIETCWEQSPADRPHIDEVAKKLKGIFGSMKSGSLMDNLLKRMEQYAHNLEGLVSERTGKYMEEKKRVEDLLHRLLPKSVAEELQSNSHVAPKTYDSVTVYFSDVVKFTALCSESTPMEVETIGDAYMAVSGLPEPNENHACEVARMALGLREAACSFKIPHRPNRPLLLRIGIHSGPCVSGVVGLTMPRYCLFGDTINTASRMESNGEPMKIHLSPETRELLSVTENFDISERGLVEMKGKGKILTYWLHSERQGPLVNL